jgi:aerobic carbon-monoxide dehydrogenase small subunit
MITVSIVVNGKGETHSVEPRTLLVHFLRENCELKGTNVGCDTTQCGCCTVHLNGRSVKSCTVLAVQADGGNVTTIEGIGTSERMHPMQRAFHEHHALQCGFCTPGMVMQGIDIVRQGLGEDESAVREALEGNLCRCTGYQNIVDAIMDVALKAPTACHLGESGK